MDKVIYSVKHNTYVDINTQLATCFGSSKHLQARMGTLWDPILFTNFFKIQVKNILGDVSFEIYVKIPIS